jgi:hypothetical protein
MSGEHTRLACWFWRLAETFFFFKRRQRRSPRGWAWGRAFYLALVCPFFFSRFPHLWHPRNPWFAEFPNFPRYIPPDFLQYTCEQPADFAKATTAKERTEGQAMKRK